MTGTSRKAGPTVAQLRDDIDSGRTGDKVAWPDPAVAPLGTDDEAAGTPPSPAVVAAARDFELGRRVSQPRPFQGTLWLAPLLLLVVSIAVLLAMLL